MPEMTVAFVVGFVVGGAGFGYLGYEVGKGKFLNDVAQAYKTDVESIKDKIKAAKKAAKKAAVTISEEVQKAVNDLTGRK